MSRIFLTGASAGIGLLSARSLCARGHAVWGTARDIGRLPVIDRFHPVALDLNDTAGAEAAFQAARAQAGAFDVLINNAGAGFFGPVEAFSDSEFTAQWETLVAGPLRLIRLALPDMRARGSGLIVNVSSLAGELPLPFLTPYSLCKAALSALSEGLNLELAHTAIRVVDVRPSDFATRFHESTRRVSGDLSSAYAPNLERAWDTIGENMRRAPDPQRVADLLVRIVEGEIRRPVVLVGDVFQSRVAPLLARLAPRSWVQWGLRVYYGLQRGG